MPPACPCPYQEGHTAHATAEEAEAEARKMLQVYEDFAWHVVAMPVVAGRKSKTESFAGGPGQGWGGGGDAFVGVQGWDGGQAGLVFRGGMGSARGWELGFMSPPV